jgi:chaperonin GroEL
MTYITNESNPFEIKKGMEIAKEKVLEFLDEIKQEVCSEKELFNVANVSCNYNKNIAEIVSHAIWKSGINGIIEIEPGTKLENELLVLMNIRLTT